MVIEGLSTPGGNSFREIYEARNHDRRFDTSSAWRWTLRKRLLDERELLNLHAIELADIDPAAAGRFRSERVRIAGSGLIPPGSHRFDQLIQEMLGLAQRTDCHPALWAAEFHHNLVVIHPFADGNGRTARLAMNHLLLSRGHPYCLIEVGERRAYLAALDEANTEALSHSLAWSSAASCGRWIA